MSRSDSRVAALRNPLLTPPGNSVPASRGSFADGVGEAISPVTRPSVCRSRGTWSRKKTEPAHAP